MRTQKQAACSASVSRTGAEVVLTTGIIHVYGGARLRGIEARGRTLPAAKRALVQRFRAAWPETFLTIRLESEGRVFADELARVNLNRSRKPSLRWPEARAGYVPAGH